MAEERGRLSDSGNILDATASQLAQVGVGFCDFTGSGVSRDQRLRKRARGLNFLFCGAVLMRPDAMAATKKC